MRIPYKNNDAGCGTVLAIILVAIGLLFFVNWIGCFFGVLLQQLSFLFLLLAIGSSGVYLFSAIFFLLVRELVQVAKIKLYGLAAPKFFTSQLGSALLIVFEREILLKYYLNTNYTN